MRKEPTCTTLALSALASADDFVTAAQLTVMTHCTPNQVGAALSHLRSHKAVDCMACAGNLWWFTTPDSDDRSRCVHERKPEVNKRKPRKAKKAAS